jgi:hypothetical protein
LSRFQASVADIKESLAQRFRQHRWKKNRPASRQYHWLKGLLTKIRFHLGPGWTGDPMDAFEQFRTLGVCPVGRSI